MLALGFVQERLKISLNFYLEQSAQIPGFYDLDHQQRAVELEKRKSAVHAPYDYYWSHTSVYAYNYLNFRSLTGLKWGMAIVFVGLTFLLSQVILKYWFGSAYRGDWLVYGFAAVLLLIVLIAGMSFVFNISKLTYPLLRELLGIIQSPVPLLIIGILKSFSPVKQVN